MVRRMPLAAMDRVIREIGAERVSDDAKDALRDVLESEGRNLIRKAVSLSKHVGRKTVLKEDIKLVCD